MELVEGKPLAHLIPSRGIPPEQIFDIASPLANGPATAHEKGIIHRDLQPANIMVSDEVRVKVLDFGLAKLRQEAEVPSSSGPSLRLLVFFLLCLDLLFAGLLLLALFLVFLAALVTHRAPPLIPRTQGSITPNDRKHQCGPGLTPCLFLPS